MVTGLFEELPRQGQEDKRNWLHDKNTKTQLLQQNAKDYQCYVK